MNYRSCLHMCAFQREGNHQSRTKWYELRYPFTTEESSLAYYKTFSIKYPEARSLQSIHNSSNWKYLPVSNIFRGTHLYYFHQAEQKMFAWSLVYFKWCAALWGWVLSECKCSASDADAIPVIIRMPYANYNIWVHMYEIWSADTNAF